jgi:hypothetical protein
MKEAIVLNAAATVLYFKQCGGTPTQEDGLAFNTAVSLTSKGTVMAVVVEVSDADGAPCDSVRTCTQ